MGQLTFSGRSDGAGRLVLANSSLQQGVRSRVWLMPGRLVD